MKHYKIGILSDQHSVRLGYVLDFVFDQFFGQSYEFVKETDDASFDLLVGYGKVQSGSYQLSCSNYLFSNDYSVNETYLKADHPDFDLFALCFFMLSRAEEYNHQSNDELGRFSASESFLASIGKLYEPYLDQCLLAFAKQIEVKTGVKLVRRSTFDWHQTIDIDQFYAYKGKSIIKTLGGLARSFIKFKPVELNLRIGALITGLDPFDRIPFLEKNVQEASKRSQYFFLIGDYDQRDNALDLSQQKIKSKIQKLSQTASIGIHPSIKSNQSPELIVQEKAKLELITGKKITKSRQHFLVLNFPETYRRLILNEITEDFSLGFHDDLGFRAGTTESFFWFDLSANKVTELLIHPFQCMDVALRRTSNDLPVIRQNLRTMIKNCYAVNGEFRFLWHNSSFYELEDWKSWKSIYLDLLNYCKELAS